MYHYPELSVVVVKTREADYLSLVNYVKLHYLFYNDCLKYQENNSNNNT